MSRLTRESMAISANVWQRICSRKISNLIQKSTNSFCMYTGS